MSDEFLLHAFIVKPVGVPVGHLHILHGMAEHSGRYIEFAMNLVKNGYIVSGHDHRGHGKTTSLNGTRGYFADRDGFNRVVEDAYEVISYFREFDSSPNSFFLGIVWVRLSGDGLFRRTGNL